MTRNPSAEDGFLSDESDSHDRHHHSQNFPRARHGSRNPARPMTQLTLDGMGDFDIGSVHFDNASMVPSDVLKFTKPTPVDELVPFYEIDFGLC
jgi:hypothetical protein